MQRRPRRSPRIALVGLLIATSIFGALTAFVLTPRENQAGIIGALPRPVRTAFLNLILGGQKEPCRLCRPWVVGALDYILLEAKTDPTIRDYNRKSLRFIHQDAEQRAGGRGVGPYFEEPRPMLACRAMLLKRDPELFRVFYQDFAGRPASRNSCLRSGAHWASIYDLEGDDAVDVFIARMTRELEARGPGAGAATP